MPRPSPTARPRLVLAQRVFSVLLMVVVAPVASATEVPLVKTRGGVYAVPVEINEAITLNFVVDSGAAEVNIPVDVVLTLIRANTIAPSDFLPGATYVQADGTATPSERFTIRKVRIGDHVIRGVSASVGPIESPLLLGQSVLQRMGWWTLDTDRWVMVLGEPGTTAEPAARVPVPPPPANQGCDEWRSAPPTCAVGFVRQYYEDLSRRDCGAAMAKWGSPPSRTRDLCRRASSTFQLAEVALAHASADAATVAVRALEVDKHRANVVICWQLTVRLVQATPWAISELHGTRCNDQ